MNEKFSRTIVVVLNKIPNIAIFNLVVSFVVSAIWSVIAPPEFFGKILFLGFVLIFLIVTFLINGLLLMFFRIVIPMKGRRNRVFISKSKKFTSVWYLEKVVGVFYVFVGIVALILLLRLR